MTIISRLRETVSSLTWPLSEPLDLAVDLDGPLVEQKAAPAGGEQYCRLMRDERRPSDRVLAQAWRKLEDSTALVPAGETTLTSLIEALEDETGAVAAGSTPVDSLYIDRFAVTNQQFAEFVNDGGYDREELWATETLPYLLQFVDQSGVPAPKHWVNGRPPADKRNHPVVGVSWFEAQAFSVWAGRRLPTPSEWQHSACWFSTADGPTGASFTWGNAFNPEFANTWHASLGTTVEVDAFRDGATPNGVYQLIGNVWEWTACQFGEPEQQAETRLLFEQPMAEVRGGAYDTYFETQATSQFRTGQRLLYRGPNVGFRCCVTAHDLPAPPDPSAFLMETP